VSPKSQTPTLVEMQLRELALVDRIIGLEAEVARLSIESGIKDIRILKKSRPWRVGRLVLSPIYFIKRFQK